MHYFSTVIDFLNNYKVINFSNSCLKTDATIYPKFNLPINIYFVINASNPPSTTIDLANPLYGMMFYIKNGKQDLNKYPYSGCGVSFGSKKYAHSNGKDCYDRVIFGVDMSDSNDVENKKKQYSCTS